MKKWVIGILLALIIAATVVFTAAPWKTWLEREMKVALAGQGLGQMDFVLESVGLDKMTIADITFKQNLPLTIGRLVIDYSWLELLQGRPNKIEAPELNMTFGEKQVMAYDAAIQFITPEEGQSFRATWSVGNLQLMGLPLDIPSLAGTGTLAIRGDSLEAKGDFASKDKSAQAVFSLSYNQQDPAHSRLVMHRFLLPWNDGALAMKEARFPLSKGQEGSVTVEARKVSLNLLLAALTQDRAQATGTVSGQIPVTIHRDGTFTVHAAKLSAVEPGTVTLQPDAIPGDNAQLALLREVLGDFHYKQLAMGVNSDKERKLSLSLTLEGNNPNAYDGKPIKLNVHLTGDVLSFLEQSVMPMTDPRQLIEQGNHAQP